MLVSERFHGKVDPVYLFIDQFNSVFASVSIKGRNYYLDSTDKTIPLRITPSSILNTTAFVVNSKSGGLVNIVNDTSLYKEEIIAQLVIDSTASIKGSVLVKSSDYARMEKLSEYKRDEKKFLLANFIVDGTTA